MNPRDLKLEFFDPQLDNKEDKPGRFRAVICASNASRTTGEIWKDENARLVWFQQWGSGNLGWALCRRLEPDIGLGVWIEYNHALQQFEVMEDDGIQRSINSNRRSYLAPTETDFLPGGRFQLWVDAKMIQPLAIYSNGGITISIVEGDYIYGGTRKTYNGVVDYDLTALQPAGPDEHLLIGVYLDSSNTLQFVSGTSVDIGLNAPEPTWPAGAFRLGVIDLNDSQTDITIDDIVNRKIVWTEDNGTTVATGGGVWPLADEVNIDDAQYASWALAVAALDASEQAIIGEGTFVSADELINTASYVLGSGLDVSILSTDQADAALNLQSASIILEAFSLQNTSAAAIYGDCYAALIGNSANVTAYRVKFEASGATANDNYAVYIDGGTHRFVDCVFDAENGDSNYALYITGGATVELVDCDIIGDVVCTGEGSTLDIYQGSVEGDLTQADSAGFICYHIYHNGSTSGSIGGWYYDDGGQQHSFPYWADWTPTLTQSGAVAKTVNYAREWRIDDKMTLEIKVSATAAGTGGNAIEISNLSQPIINTGDGTKGTFTYYDAGTYYQGSAIAYSSSVLRFIVNGASGYFGVNPAVTIASGDILTVQVTYEIGIIEE